MRLAPIVIGALLAWGSSLGRAQDDGAERALQAGAYAEAESLALGRLAAVEAANDPDALEVARALDLVVAAEAGNGKTGDDTLDHARRALRIKQRRLEPDALDISSSFHHLGGIYDRRGEFRTALPLHERGLAIRRARVPPDSPDIADSLDATARTLLSLDRRPEAEQAIERSLVIRLAHHAESPLALAGTLELSGRAKRDGGLYKEAAAQLDRALELWSRFAPGHPDKASALDARGYVYFLEGDIPGARLVWTEAALLTDERLNAWHPARARSARSLAIAEKAVGALAEARSLRERAAAIGERAMARCDPEVAAQLNDLAISLQYDGDYPAADRMFRRELATMHSCLAPNQNLATAVFNQFGLAREMGSYSDAQRLGELAVRLWSRSLGPSHPFVAFGLNELADFFASRGDQIRAQQLFERALRIRRRALGPGHPDVAWTLTGLARSKADARDLAGARAVLQDAIAIFQNTPPRDPDYLPTALALRGTLEARGGAYGSARATLEDALEARVSSLGNRHPLVASTRADVAAIDLALGEYDQAFAGALMAETSARDLLRFTVRYIPDRRAMEYARARPRGLDIALSAVAGRSTTSGSQALDAVIQSRGIVLDELAARARSVSAGSAQIASIAASVGDARRRYAALVLRNLSGQQPEAPLLERVRQEKEDAEERLAAQSAVLRTELSRVNAGLLDVRRAMPPRSALVSFVRYDRTEYMTRADRIQRRMVQSYLALVSWSDRTDVELVPLGPAASLEALIAQWREEAGGRQIVAGVDAAEAERSYRAIGTRLRQRIWDPITPFVASADRTFIVPDGAINLVSFAALPTSGQRYLIQDSPSLHYLSTERDLLPDIQPVAEHGLLLVGGPAYDASGSASRSAANVHRGCTPEGPLRFDDLPGTRVEVRDIAALWSSRPESARAPGDDVVVLSGRAATKRAVIDAARGRKILHLATHGFFLGDCGPQPAGTRSVGGLVGQSRAVPADTNPLLLAGLAFAGANIPTRQSSSDTGILTAEEVSALNLQGTEWAVLSACDTGLGQTTSGEGVLGLRRAFQVAGVRTIIMSLWSVEDRATQDWMVALYRARLLDRLDTIQAVRRASLTVLLNRKTKGVSTYPFYWAAFVAAGDWR